MVIVAFRERSTTGREGGKEEEAHAAGPLERERRVRVRVRVRARARVRARVGVRAGFSFS